MIPPQKITKTFYSSSSQRKQMRMLRRLKCAAAKGTWKWNNTWDVISMSISFIPFTLSLMKHGLLLPPATCSKSGPPGHSTLDPAFTLHSSHSGKILWNRTAIETSKKTYCHSLSLNVSLSVFFFNHSLNIECRGNCRKNKKTNKHMQILI